MLFRFALAATWLKQAICLSRVRQQEHSML
jgi:hypothetical protein